MNRASVGHKPTWQFGAAWRTLRIEWAVEVVSCDAAVGLFNTWSGLRGERKKRKWPDPLLTMMMASVKVGVGIHLLGCKRDSSYPNSLCCQKRKQVYYFSFILFYFLFLFFYFLPSDAQLERLKHRSKLSQLSVSCPPPPSELYECVIVSLIVVGDTRVRPLGVVTRAETPANFWQLSQTTWVQIFIYFFLFFLSIWTLCMNAALHTRK